MMDLLSPHLDELERPWHNGGKNSILFYFEKKQKVSNKTKRGENNNYQLKRGKIKLCNKKERKDKGQHKIKGIKEKV